MWAILVVAIINTLHDADRVEEVQEIPDDLPGDLEEVFNAILARDERGYGAHAAMGVAESTADEVGRALLRRRDTDSSSAKL